MRTFEESKNVCVDRYLATALFILAVLLFAFPVYFALAEYINWNETLIRFSNPPPYATFAIIYLLISLLFLVYLVIPTKSSSMNRVLRFGLCLACWLLHIFSIPFLPGIPWWFHEYSTFLYIFGSVTPVAFFILSTWLLVRNVLYSVATRLTEPKYDSTDGI